ncbi:LysR family transcriptional regulator [Microvirga antarctica]|uniref:LysR family transcriptional regulator n=1 Tax=Microvirga antarctica TaxID=2819233 RepID=UPI001B30B3F6|nr:LysR family transcriptional regulator [Microvirga antarctica]
MAPPPVGPSRTDAAQPAWDDLRIFLGVVAHGSMNGAGRALGQSQPTIARRIRVLEDVLGVALFERGPNHLALTQAGRAVLEAASPMAEAAGAVPRLAAAYRGDSSAPVRITATMSLTLFLSHHAAEIAAAIGPIALAYLPTRRRLDLATGEADIALRMRSLPDSDSLVARRIGRIAFAVYARSPDVAAVIVPPEDPLLSQQAALIARFAAGRPIAARIGDMPIRHQAAKSGLGAAVLPCWLGDTDPDLVRVLPPPDDMIEDASLVMHRRSRDLPNVKTVAQAIVALFKTRRDLLAGLAPRDRGPAS